MTTSNLITLLTILIALSSLLISWRTFAISRTMGTEDIVFGEKIKIYKDMLEKLMKIVNAAYVVESHMEAVKSKSAQPDEKELTRIRNLYHDAAEAAFYCVHSNAHMVTTDCLTQAQGILTMANFDIYVDYAKLEDVKQNNKSRLEKTQMLINQIREEIKIDKVHANFADRVMNTMITWQSKD
jgi:hypothetical protein